MKVLVASKNPVKLNSVQSGFEACFKQQVCVYGITANSEVPDQPGSDEETLRGAQNRVKNAMVESAGFDFYVGIEGGIEKTDGQLLAFAWIAISDGKNSSKARTGSFVLPHEVSRLIGEGLELGEADDKVFDRDNSKQQNGAVGLLTNDLITRETLYHQAIILALIPFINSTSYFHD